MSDTVLWSQTLGLLGEEEYRWLEDAVATIAHAVKIGKANEFQAWVLDAVDPGIIREAPDIRFTKSKDWYTAHFVSKGSEILELHVAIIQRFLELHRPMQEFSISWAETSPKFVSGGFGGGCVIIGATTTEYLDVKEWLLERISVTHGQSTQG